MALQRYTSGALPAYFGIEVQDRNTFVANRVTFARTSRTARP